MNDSASNRSVELEGSEAVSGAEGGGGAAGVPGSGAAGTAGPGARAAGGSPPLRDGDIGLITDPDVPLLHAVRLLCTRFLLTGHPMGLIPDRQVRH